MSKARRGKNLFEMGHSKKCSCCICLAKKGELKISREIRICKYKKCKNKFKVKVNSKRKYCSRNCANKSTIDGKPSGKDHPMYGRHHSDETKQKMRGPRNIYNGDHRGSKNPMWKGGICQLPYPFDFNNELKTLIRKRDKYICQLCNKTQRQEGRKLSVHHIDYDKDNLSPKNLISLCKSCNSKVNSNRKKWTNFFKDPVIEHFQASRRFKRLINTAGVKA